MSYFENFSGLTFVGITAETKVRLTGGKSNPHKDRITKISRVSGLVYKTDNTNTYQNQVRKEIPNFEPQARRWGNRVNNLPVIMHNGAQYLELIIQNAKTEGYFLDGQPIDKSEIEGLPEKKLGKHSVIVRDYSAESIKEIRINGQEYKA